MPKKIIALAFLLIVIVFFAFQSGEKAQVETSGETNQPATHKEVITAPEKTSAPSSLDISSEKKTPSVETGQEKNISQETERDFLKLKIPETLPSSPKERYQVVYSTYLISSFYINEVAAGHLNTNKERLTKAFKGMALYFKEMDSAYQPDSALAIIEANQSALFHDALAELSPEDKALIEEALKLQSEED